MQIERIVPSQFRVSAWSGGTTTELAIDPPESDFKARAFRLRISSATFTGTSSTFSDFTGYQRYLLPLEGTLSVAHAETPEGEALYARTLLPYNVEYFPGRWNTASTNSLDCRDFNLIVREDLAAHVQVFAEEGAYTPKKMGELYLYSVGDYGFAVNALSTEDARHLEAVEAGTLVHLTEDETFFSLRVLPEHPVIVCEVNPVQGE